MHTVLIVHSAYRHPGGEEFCIENEKRTLTASGDWRVLHYSTPTDVSNSTAMHQGMTAPVGGGRVKEFIQVLDTHHPDLLHAHNLFPALSPQIFGEAKQRGIRTVWTLHNYRPLCLNGLFLRPSGELCERCAQGNYLWGILYGCYRGSRIQSTGLAAHLTKARQSHWYDAVDHFIAPSAFLRAKFIESGFPASRFSVQGHFLPDIPGDEPVSPDPYLLYIGRLSKEKGLDWLIDTFLSADTALSLRIAGTGPLENRLRNLQHPRVSWLGHVEGPVKNDLLRRALAVVLPSACYENFPMTVAEANAWGTPAIVQDHGGMKEMVTEGKNGFHFHRSDSDSFWAAVNRILDAQYSAALRRSAQAHAKELYSATRFLEFRNRLYASLLESPG